MKLSAEQENFLAQYSFEQIQSLTGQLSNRAARKWYIYQDSLIPSQVDGSLSLEEQARVVWERK